MLWFLAKIRPSSQLDQYFALPHQTGADLFSKLGTKSCIQSNTLRLNISLLNMLRNYWGTFA